MSDENPKNNTENEVPQFAITHLDQKDNVMVIEIRGDFVAPMSNYLYDYEANRIAAKQKVIRAGTFKAMADKLRSGAKVLYNAISFTDVAEFLGNPEFCEDVPAVDARLQTMQARRLAG